MTTISFAKWVCGFLGIPTSKDAIEALSPALEHLCTVPEPDIESEVRKFLERRFKITDENISLLTMKVKKSRAISGIPVAWGSPLAKPLKSKLPESSFSAILCVPVNIGDAKFEELCPEKIPKFSPIKGLIISSVPKQFTFSEEDIQTSAMGDVKSDEWENPDLEIVIKKVCSCVTDKTNFISIKREISSWRVYHEMIRYQLRKETTLKNKINLLILQEEYRKVIPEGLVDEETNKAIAIFLR